ncbi:gamma-glutamyltransferase family protein [Metabacillus sp. GX 13764]|uniref:gamma-glutamyltransferase family protein n=1 Tax=Metabacillus kandeliae TaxID=2900151 RepID=UPI001E3F3227|nr:gamma-glutamyltransferase [Metabacillus kandeliae]MCD7035588.1 gamma-glutamyltransferase family protein [Metabacillus kandeliae]
MSKKWITRAVAAVMIALILLFAIFRCSSYSGPDGGGTVSANNALATEAGTKVLRDGGNAVDAAVAVSYALGVVEPFASGIGGSGVMVVYNPKKNIKKVYDYKGISSFANLKSKDSIAVPGFVKGLETAHIELGEKPMDELIAPAIKYAEKGFKADKFLTDRLTIQKKEFHGLPKSFYPNGKPLKPGQLVKQQDLAKTMKLIQKNGSDAVYGGEIGKKIAERADAVTEDDFKKYTVKKSEPVEGKFGNYHILTSPPPTGGVTLLEILKMAELYKGEFKENQVTNYVHLIGEITKQAYKDRIQQIGDPAFTEADANQMLSSGHIEKQAKNISFDKVSFDIDVNDTEADKKDYENTTHFSIKDSDGTIVSVTNTLGNFFGSGYHTAGIFLNNDLTRFSENKNSPNRIQPGKRPNSYITPAILASKDETVGIGTPGGKRIPMVIAQALIQHEYFGKSWQEAIKERRFYIEGKKLYAEPGYPKNVRDKLEKRGYDIRTKKSPFFYGGINAVIDDRKNSREYGAADPRRTGTWSTAN